MWQGPNIKKMTTAVMTSPLFMSNFPLCKYWCFLKHTFCDMHIGGVYADSGLSVCRCLVWCFLHECGLLTGLALSLRCLTTAPTLTPRYWPRHWRKLLIQTSCLMCLRCKCNELIMNTVQRGDNMVSKLLLSIGVRLSVYYFFYCCYTKPVKLCLIMWLFLLVAYKRFSNSI